MVTQMEIARRAGIDISSVNKILNRKEGAVFKKETVRRVFKIARELGYDLERLRHHHRRRHPRQLTEFRLELSIYLANGSLFDRGQATMRDVSLSGALLSGILLTGQKGIPLEPHTIGMRLLDGPLKDLEIQSKPVRFMRRRGGIHLAVAFEGIQESALLRLRKIV
jgi:transcriptional regulator with XRE-family HTH domain